MTASCAQRWSLLAAVVAAFAAQPAVAQSIRATVLDGATGTPVAEALVRVAAEDGAVVSSGFVNEGGVVVLRVRRPGTYRVEAERSGYTAAAVQVEAGGAQVQVELRMGRRPFVLDTVVAFGQRRNERGRHGFERRRSLGLGVFLDSTYLADARRRASYVNDVLMGVPGLQMVRPRGGPPVPQSVRGWRCMVLLVDGDTITGPPRPLHQMIAPRDIKGAEVYREFSEVPEEYRRFAYQGMYPCGVYLYWTRARW